MSRKCASSVRGCWALKRDEPPWFCSSHSGKRLFRKYFRSAPINSRNSCSGPVLLHNAPGLKSAAERFSQYKRFSREQIQSRHFFKVLRQSLHCNHGRNAFSVCCKMRHPFAATKGNAGTLPTKRGPCFHSAKVITGNC